MRSTLTPGGRAPELFSRSTSSRVLYTANDARAVAAHLLAAGAPTVHHLAGPVGSFAAAERERGWREALAEAGVPAPEIVRGDWTAASGHAAVAALPETMTALFAANDQMALGALRALAEAGRPVPSDVAVVGFDDVEEVRTTTEKISFSLPKNLRADLMAVQGGPATHKRREPGADHTC